MSSEKQFELGPIQEAWLKRLEEHPERQDKEKLGVKHPDGTYTACCLGEGLLTLCELTSRVPAWSPDGTLFDGDSADPQWRSSLYLQNSWRELGLRSSAGLTADRLTCLAELNDHPKTTWVDIAAAIRANPENFFTKSV